MEDLTENDTSAKAPYEMCVRADPQPPSSALRDESLNRVFKAVEQTFRRVALHQMRKEGIEDIFPGSAPLILHLGDEDGLPLSELGKRCGLESSTMTPLVDELERRGLAHRSRAPEDRRVVRLYLSEKGRALEPRLRALVWRLQEISITGIPESEIEVMRSVLERIVVNLENLIEQG
ncbi:MAG TPA: MarR family transcriptional regulator [Chthonomonadaceae bacterium]|nr:MarR family transcriptional regulator [Chthonomonadaceae bacterium]